MENSKALLGAGCFWGVEETFQKLDGIIKSKVGYAGGTIKYPTYEEVCSDTTGHAEVVYIEFDSNIISYKQILNIFWKSHDPTQFNRQGFDVGSQYRSIIFYFNDEQRNIAKETMKNLQLNLSNQIMTEIIKFDSFYLAEEYHQCYIKKKQTGI